MKHFTSLPIRVFVAGNTAWLIVWFYTNATVNSISPHVIFARYKIIEFTFLHAKLNTVTLRIQLMRRGSERGVHNEAWISYTMWLNLDEYLFEYFWLFQVLVTLHRKLGNLRKSIFSKSLNLEWIHEDLESCVPFIHVANPSGFEANTQFWNMFSPCGVFTTWPHPCTLCTTYVHLLILCKLSPILFYHAGFAFLSNLIVTVKCVRLLTFSLTMGSIILKTL